MGVDWQDLLQVRRVREELGLSQQGLADLIGVSLRTVQSCEQGWRRPTAALERSLLLLLLASRNGPDLGKRACWDSSGSPPDACEQCLVRRSRQGHLCWLLTGNVCKGRRLRSWSSKKAVCGECRFLRRLLRGG